MDLGAGRLNLGLTQGFASPEKCDLGVGLSLPICEVGKYL